MKKLLLHLGLPKTATSSIQHNVFRSLHQAGDINFLGKDLSFCYETGQVEVHNYSGDFIRKVADGRMTISEGKKYLHKVLKSNILNVFSDEGIMVSYPGLENNSLQERFDNLKELLFDIDVELVITLRDPVDYFYSLYVELYPEYFSQIKKLNSFEKCVDYLFTNKNDLIFESLFYSKYLTKIEEIGCLNKFHFDDLVKNKEAFYSAWSELLRIEQVRFKYLFESKHVNEKKVAKGGVQKITSLKFVVDWFKGLFKNNETLYNIFKSLYYNSGLNIIFSKRIFLRANHNKPVGEYRKKICVFLINSE